MPDLDRAAIQARLDAATPAASLVLNRYEHGGGRMFVEDPRQLVADFYDEANRELYAHAPTDLAALLVYTERLEKALKEISMRRWEDRQPGDAEDAVPYGAVSRVLTIARAALARREGEA